MNHHAWRKRRWGWGVFMTRYLLRLVRRFLRGVFTFAFRASRRRDSEGKGRRIATCKCQGGIKVIRRRLREGEERDKDVWREGRCS